MSNKRKSLSKKLRFEVFKRDNFHCQYCNASPPEVPLEIDHLIPVSKGGENLIDNLVTACFDCNRGKSNRGKSNILMDIVPPPLSETIERRRVAQLQYLEYKKVLKKDKKIIKDDINSVELIYNNSFEDYLFSNKFRITVKSFIKKLGVSKVEESMESACIKIYWDEQKVLKYFCGICWKTIKGDVYE